MSDTTTAATVSTSTHSSPPAAHTGFLAGLEHGLASAAHGLGDLLETPTPAATPGTPAGGVPAVPGVSRLQSSLDDIIDFCVNEAVTDLPVLAPFASIIRTVAYNVLARFFSHGAAVVPAKPIPAAPAVTVTTTTIPVKS